MIISYEKIFERYYGLIDDVKELSINDNDLLELCTERLRSATSYPYIRKLFSTLTFDNEIQQCDFELSTPVDDSTDEDFVIELLNKF